MRRPIETATAAEGIYLHINEMVVLDFYYDEIRLSDEFMVIHGLIEEVILGVNTLQKWPIKFDFEHHKVIIDPKVAKAILK